MSSSGTVLLAFLLPALAVAVAPASPAISVADACRSSIDPEFCCALLSPVQSASNLFKFGFYSVDQALKQAQRSAADLRRYIEDAGGNASRSADDHVPRTSLEICGSLAGHTVSHLASVKEELGRGEEGVTSDQAARVRSLMSSVVTNQVTCSDMLVENNSVGYPPKLPDELANGTRLFGVSLDLVTSALQETAAGASDFLKDLGNVNIKRTLTVTRDGKGDFATVGEAVNAAVLDRSGGMDPDSYILIQVGPGTFNENVVVGGSNNRLMFVGAGINMTVLTSSRSTTNGHQIFDTGAFTVRYLEKVIVKNMTFENTAGPSHMQATAVVVSSDLTVFHGCSFLGYQDTLYTHSGRQFYRDCDIYGTIDFIFGDSTAVLQNCRIFVRLPIFGQYNVVTAQGRTVQSSATGISIHECTILPTPDMMDAMKKGKAPSTYLGRPWKDYSRVVIMQSHISGMVDKAGWAKFGGEGRLSTLYYGEYNNDGDGADTRARVKWPGYKQLSTGEANTFTVKNFINATEWLTAMSIPNDAGLI